MCQNNHDAIHKTCNIHMFYLWLHFELVILVVQGSYWTDGTTDS